MRGKSGFPLLAKAQFARNDFLGEIAVADKKRHDENARRKNSAHHLGQVRLLFPEALQHLREKAAPAQFIGVLASGRGRIGIERRAVSGQHQGRV